MANPELTPAALLIRQQVADFDAWKKVFDEGESMRREGGIVAHHINRAENDPNELAVFLAVGDLEKAKAYTESDALKDFMDRAGVISKPEVTWMAPARQSEDLDWETPTPSMLVTHKVEDFDSWLSGYDQAAGIQKEHGIIAQAANRSLDDPSEVIVYHQAKTSEELHEFAESEDLKHAMKAAGVSSAPDISYHTGGWGKSY